MPARFPITTFDLSDLTTIWNEYDDEVVREYGIDCEGNPNYLAADQAALIKIAKEAFASEITDAIAAEPL